MKQLIVSVGLEKICMMTVENKGKVIKVYETKSVDSGKVLREDGMYSYTDLAKVLNDIYGKSIRAMEVWLVLPDLATNTDYVDTQKVQGMKVSELPDMVNSKFKDKHVCFVGENATYDISQIVYFSKKNIKTLVSELYSKKIPITKAISNFTAVHNAGFFLGETRSGSYTSLSSSAKVMMVVGIHRISYIVLANDLPVHIRESDYNLMKTHSILREVYGNITFGDMLKVMRKNLSIKSDEHLSEEDIVVEIPLVDLSQLEEEDGNKEGYERDEAEIQELKQIAQEKRELELAVLRETKEMAQSLSREMSSVNDMVSSKYGTDNIEFIVIEETAQEYLKQEFGAFKISELGDLPDTIDLGSATLDMRILKEKPRDMIVCIGAILESLKKGADFYE